MYIETNNFGLVKILGDGEKKYYWKVLFLNKNTIQEFRRDAILKGEIRDRFAPTLCGIGIIGDIKTKGEYAHAYTLWRNMIMRCYDGKNEAYHGKVFVCERWKTFSNFFEDIPKIDGYSEEKFNGGFLELDKDIKQRWQSEKIYSLDTCIFVEKTLNSKIQDSQQKRFIAISPNGDRYSSENIADFARQHNLERRQISAVLHKRFKSTLGWKFYYAEEEIV